jgi:hypothetical protein
MSEETQTGLSINDLAGLRQIIAVAAQRGAFKAEEMEIVGQHYNRLNAFLQSVAPQTETEETTEEETSSEE